MTNLLEVDDLRKDFVTTPGFLRWRPTRVRAVNGVSLAVREGETLGIAGESGCGKSTLARCLVRLIEPSSGRIWFAGEDLLAMNGKELRRRRREFQLIFQNPYGSLNPRMRVGDIIGEGVRPHGRAAGGDERARVRAVLERVGLPANAAGRYPHEFSGGQRQRIGIARALAVQPRLIVADEPVSALDVSVQAQIVNLLEDLQSERSLTYVFIAHDLRLVEHISHRVAIMYLGRFVELMPGRQLVQNARHPYTRALLSAVPALGHTAPGARSRATGEVPSPLCAPRGCAFHPRCAYAEERCRKEEPELVGQSGHRVACHVFPA